MSDGQPDYLKEISIRYRKRRVSKKAQAKQPIDTPQKVAALFPYLQIETKETMLALCLDAKKRLICFETVAVGSVQGIYGRPAEALRAAVAINAPALILVHNHPSGDPSPSQMDRDFTTWLRIRSHELGIEFCDHVIVARDGVYSFERREIL